MSAITGMVSVENDGLGGVTVKISGVSDSETQSDADGQYAFDGLRAGDYTIEISGFDNKDVTFDSISSAVTVAVDESKVVNFEGDYVHTSGIMGQVSVEGNPLMGVSVRLQGKGVDRTETTDSAGQYSFDELRYGDYSVAISGYDADEYDFDPTSKTISLASDEIASVSFEGTKPGTAAIMGAVTIGGAGLEGVTVSLSGGGQDRSVVTNAAGEYAFDRLPAGDYTVVISGYDTDKYGFEATSTSVTVALNETATVEFDGIPSGTVGISGQVSVAGRGLGGVIVTLTGEEDRTGPTDDRGQFSFSGLAAGAYTLSISAYDEDEYEFDTSQEIVLAFGEAKIANFEGRSLRTVVVMGTGSVEGEALPAVSLTLTRVLGANADEIVGTLQTRQDAAYARYALDELLAGAYRVESAGFDDEYDFDAESWTGAVTTDETATTDLSGRQARADLGIPHVYDTKLFADDSLGDLPALSVGPRD